MAFSLVTHNLRVGFVGLGSQGGPMARRIIDGGFTTTLWARRTEALSPFEGTGAIFAVDRRHLGAFSDVLCICVLNDDDVTDVLCGSTGALADMKSGGIVVIHSTVHPRTCHRLQADYPHLSFLDAPVSGGGHRAASGELLVMVGGEPAALEKCRPVLETFGDPLLHLGALGAGQEAKLLNNALFTAQLGLAASTFELAARRGVDAKALTNVITCGSGRSYAAEVLAGTDHDLKKLGEVAGRLLAKDLGILKDTVGTGGGLRLIGTAESTIESMELPGAGGEGSEGV